MGIITDTEKWYFMKYTQDSEGKLSFKLSKPLFVVYEDSDMRVKAAKVLGHIIWLLEEVQKPAEASQSGVKRVKSLSNLAGKGSSSTKSN